MNRCAFIVLCWACVQTFAVDLALAEEDPPLEKARRSPIRNDFTYGLGALVSSELAEPMAKMCREIGVTVHRSNIQPGFVRRTAEHMRGRITDWEIWNEQNIGSFWRNPNSADYLKLLRRTAAVLREVGPKNRVVLGGLAGVPLAYIEELYKLGGKDAFDVMNVHLYAEHKPANIPERFFDEQLDALKDLTDAPVYWEARR